MAESGHRAHEEYSRGHYTEALDTLTQVQSSPDHEHEDQDLPVAHNRALAEFAVSGFTDTAAWSASLESLRERHRQRAAVSTAGSGKFVVVALLVHSSISGAANSPAAVILCAR